MVEYSTSLYPKVLDSLHRVGEWVETHSYQGFEPFDGLSSFLRPLTFGNLFLDRALTQIVRRSAVNLRPILGIKPLDSTIGRGYMASGYLIMLRQTGLPEYEQKARACLEWLIENRSPGSKEFSWGKHFDFASRGGRYPRLEPITVWTSLIGMAFLEGYEGLGEEKYLDVAESVCRWIVALAKNEMPTGICLSYTGSGSGECTIHNHNMLAAAMLARMAKYRGRKEFIGVAERAMHYSCSCQLPSGGWYYGEEPMNHWIDNFHTGYNLDSIQYYIESSGDTIYMPALRRGLVFYMAHFFDQEGRPRYYSDRAFPVESQCISQSIETLTRLAPIDPSALALACKVAMWAIQNMQDREGFFYYRQGRLVRSRTPMLHWSQATMYKALALLLLALGPYNGKSG